MVDIPFIKLFRTPNSFYFLDRNKNDIIPISEDSFQYLRALFTNDRDELAMPQELINLGTMDTWQLKVQ